MANGIDCLYYSTTLIDASINGRNAPSPDSGQNELSVSNTTSGTTRTLVLTRNFAGGSGDYPFVYNDNALNVIWAYGAGLDMSQHSNNARGSSSLGFTLE